MKIAMTELIGDACMTMPAIRTYKKQNPSEPTIVYCSTKHETNTIFEHNPYIDHLIISDDLQITHSEESPIVEMNASQAFSAGCSYGKTLSWGFGVQLGIEIDSLQYDYTITETELGNAEFGIHALGEGKPVVFCSRMSHSCSSNDPRVGVANKCCSNRFWVSFAEWLIREGYQPVAIGSKKDAADSRYREWPGKILYGVPIRDIAALLRLAKAIVTVDNGIRHLAASCGAHLYCISGAIPLELIHTVPVREEQRIYEEYRLLRFVDTNTLIQGFQRVI